MEVIDLAGRLLFAVLFFDNGWAHLRQREQRVGYARSIRVPAPELAVPATGLMMLVGAALITLGVWADLGALLLVVFLPTAAYLAHAWWREEDPMAREAQKAQFFKNIALAGAALFILYAFQQFGGEIGLTLGDSPALF
jgi:putative oxidoreductase